MSGAVSGAVAAAVTALIAGAGAGCLSKPDFECPLAPEPSHLIATPIGTAGGGGTMDSDCGDRSVVGIGFTITRNPTGPADAHPVTKAALRCATITKHGDSYTTDMAEDAPLVGGFEPNIDGPFPGRCPDGQVVVGLTAHIVGTDGGLFDSVSLQCSGLGPAGAPAGDVTLVPVSQTGTVPADAMARCDAGEALHGIQVQTGSLLDRLRLSCGALSCAPP